MKLEKDLIARILICLVALINAIAAMFGFNPLGLEEDTIYNFVSTAALVGGAVWGFWKNNNFTHKARISQGWLNELKGKVK